MNKICVFCSARSPANPAYAQAIDELGRLLAINNYTTLYGGTKKGLMNILSEAVKRNYGKIIGILPEVFSHLNSPDEEIIKARDLGHRKELMILHSDAFIALPGGYGTLDELSDVIAGKIVNAHNKPIVIINTDGFYDILNDFFQKLVEEKLADNYEHLYKIVDTPEEALDYIKNYSAPEIKHYALKG